MYNAGIADGIWIPSATEVEAWERVEFCAENGRDELLRQWDTEKNGGKTPDDASSGSSAMAWWRCDKGHSFPMRIAFRTTREQGCPYCAGRRVLAGFNDLAAVAPDVAAEWHPTLNGELRPEMIMAGSSRHVWWQCPQGHVWRARVDTRIGAQHSGCPVCAGSCRRHAGTAILPCSRREKHGGM